MFLLTHVLPLDQLRNTGVTVVDSRSTKCSMDHPYHHRQCAFSLYLHRMCGVLLKYSGLPSHWSKLCRHPLPWGGRVLVLISESHRINRTHSFRDFGGCRCEPKKSSHWLHKLSAALWPLWVIPG
jgi:hypothetical protein